MILAGFSQGGAIVLAGGVRHAAKLAGIIALSTYLPLDGDHRHRAQRRQRAICRSSWVTAASIRSCRSSSALMSRDVLVKLGYEVAWHSYPMAHQVCPPEIADLRAWIAKRLATPPA